MNDGNSGASRKFVRGLAAPRSLNFKSPKIKIGPDSHARSITVHSLDQLVEECDKIAQTIRPNCTLAFRGQTQEYALDDGTISLLPGNMRQSTNLVYTFFPFPTFQDYPQTFQELSKQLALDKWDAGDHEFYSRVRGMHLAACHELHCLNGVLQHYGVPTGHLDVTTDNKIALWFAFHQVRMLDRVPCAHVDVVTYERTPRRFGIVYALEVPNPKLGVGKKVVQNVTSVNLQREVFNREWRPWRQSALTVTQDSWGPSQGNNLNMIAACIKARIIVPARVAMVAEKKYAAEWRMRWLFPTYADDAIYRRILQEDSARFAHSEKPAWKLQWIILPENVQHYLKCQSHGSMFECFQDQ